MQSIKFDILNLYKIFEVSKSYLMDFFKFLSLSFGKYLSSNKILVAKNFKILFRLVIKLPKNKGLKL
jgi:hypothetical protein